jgi:cell division septation protein DedD
VPRMPRLLPKVLGVMVLSAVGVSLSYMIVELYTAAFPKYPYRLFPGEELKAGLTGVPSKKSLPIGPIAPTPPADPPPATAIPPIVLSAPTPPSARESAMAMAFPPSPPEPPAPTVRPPGATAAPPRNAHQDSAPPALNAAPPTRPEFHVQAGAFKQRGYADTLIRQLRANGYTVTLVEESMLRVWVGPAMSRTAAERLAANLRSIGFEAFLTPIRP